MTLDVPIPDAPDITSRGTPQDFELVESEAAPDFHREELETLLHDTAWAVGVDEWLDRTDLSVDQFEAVAALGLFQAFDFYWDPADEQLEYVVPRVPEDWRERDATADLDSAAVSLIASELQDLGRTVREALEDELDRSDEVSTSLWQDRPYGERDQ